MRTGKQRARRAVLLGCGLFVLAQLLLAMCVQTRWSGLRDPDHDHKMCVLEARLVPEPGQPRPLSVVQFGSSRTVYGLRGQVAEPLLKERLGRPVVVYNMGNYGTGTLANRLAVGRLFRRGIRPDLVLLEVFPPALQEHWLHYDLRAERFHASQFDHDELQLLKRLVPGRVSLEREWWLAQAAPLYGFRLPLLTATAPTWLELNFRTDKFSGADDSGWVPLLAPRSARQRALAEVEEEYRGVAEHYRLSPRVLAVLCETVERCREAGSMVGLVLMPEGPLLRSLYPPELWRTIREAVAGVSRRTGAALLDLRETVPEAEFVDSHHLFPEGAARFSRALARRIEPLLRRAAQR
jgi:hypothetical protein